VVADAGNELSVSGKATGDGVDEVRGYVIGPEGRVSGIAPSNWTSEWDTIEVGNQAQYEHSSGQIFDRTGSYTIWLIHPGADREFGSPCRDGDCPGADNQLEDLSVTNNRTENLRVLSKSYYGRNVDDAILRLEIEAVEQTETPG